MVTPIGLSSYNLKVQNPNREFNCEQLELRIYDVTGRSVWSEVYGADAKTILVDGRQFPKGLLMYSVFIDGALIENGKILRMD